MLEFLCAIVHSLTNLGDKLDDLAVLEQQQQTFSGGSSMSVRYHPESKRDKVGGRDSPERRP